MSILVTGFEPFGARKKNVSWEAVSLLKGEGIVKACLPVSFSRAPQMICRLMDEHRPDIFLLTGMSPSRTAICVERVAINLIDAKIPDNDGVQPVDVPIVAGGENALFATLPVKEMATAVRDSGLEAVVSNSAGTYVCNLSLYTALEYAGRKGYDTKVGFVHFPDVEAAYALTALEAILKIFIK